MSDETRPRLESVDAALTARLLADHRQHALKLTEMIRADAGSLLQSRYSSLSSDYEVIALFSYALGLPLSDVREAFSQAAQSFQRVLELRGTTEAFPVVVLKYDASRSPDDRQACAEPVSLHGEGTQDYSLTNSQSSYVAVCEALIGCDDSTATRIARMIWDPPDASYIGPRSYCTPNDQHLAYALRELLHGTKASAEAELEKLNLTRSSDARIAHEAVMIRSLLNGSRRRFVDGLSELLEWHRRAAATRQGVVIRSSSSAFVGWDSVDLRS